MRVSDCIASAVGLLVCYCVATDSIPPSSTKALGLEKLSISSSSAEEGGIDLGHIVWPKDGRNQDALSKTENHIKSTGIEKIWAQRKVDKSLLLWLVYNATDSQVNEIKKDDGVLSVEKNALRKDAATLLLPTIEARLPSSVDKKVKRDVKYATQSKAASELVMISQPSTVPNLNDLESYVYEDRGGEGIFIYHVEVGIAASKGKNEFPPGQVEFLQTTLSRNENQRSDEDGGLNGNKHSTCTASKTIGQKFGAAKKATIVVVKMAEKSNAEMAGVWDLIWDDIQSKGRQKKSVITVSILDVNPADRNHLTLSQSKEKNGIANLLRNDVPVVYAAGNEAADDKGNPTQRPNVDTSPQIFSGDDFPIIVVGASDFAGVKTDFSQGGDVITTLAGGKNIKCLDRFLNLPLRASGTSYAAPLVAGVLATFLSQDPVPFDMSTGQVANNARKFLKDQANWQRHPNDKVVWNGVNEANNPKKPAAASSVAATTPIPTPTPTFTTKNECHGISGNFWVESRDVAVQNAEKFCTGRSKVYEYNNGTENDLRFSVNYIPDVSKIPTDAPNCVSAFKDAVIDGCDGNDGVKNPRNYKYGSQFSRSDGWVFKMEPLAEHIDSDNCDVSFKLFFDSFEIRGKNFPDAKLGEDGAGLLQQLRGCGGWVDKWYWALTPHDPTFQWYASGNTAAYQKNCIGHAVISAGGVTVGDCSGAG